MARGLLHALSGSRLLHSAYQPGADPGICTVTQRPAPGGTADVRAPKLRNVIMISGASLVW